MTAVIAAMVVAGCGASPPAAPPFYAKRLDSATSSISGACGAAYQLAAFPGATRSEFTTLEVTAAVGARRLATVYHRNPAWVYQGETIGQIVSDSDAMLGSCGLDQARAVLRSAIR